MAVNMDNKINAWKNKLLDLGKRNRLISYHQTKRSTLTIKRPDIFELWDIIVKNEEVIEFPFYDDATVADETGREFYENTDCFIETNQTVKELQKTLRNLRNKAKMAMEEQGINILYLAFGFLRWTESENSSEYITSPLILVPVNLTVESITSPFALRLGDDEIVLNPALRYKFEDDFGMTLPDFDEEPNLNTYFQQIQKLVQKNNWQVMTDAGLSLFSFLKINMYTDLEKHRDIIAANPVVRAIGGDTSAVKQIPDELNYYDFDKQIKPIDAFQIVDADSSQQEAILCAKNGVSFVLQGPPGTGKSQTITNIIAECLADGKKVLFVSEKMAALDVVHRRLTAAGLNDFCLVLHSHKANKKAVLEQLQNALSLARNKAQLSDEAYMKLNALYQDKEKLNQYAEQVFADVTPFGKSIYWVNGVLANLEEYEDIIFSVPDIRNTTLEKYNRYLYVLNAFKNTLGKMSEGYDSNPWNGASVQNVTNELRHDIGAKTPVFVSELKKAAIKSQEIFREVSLQFESTYTNLKHTYDLFSIAKNSPLVPVDWIMGEEITPFLDEIEQCKAQKAEFDAQKEALIEQYRVVSENDAALQLTVCEKEHLTPREIELSQQEITESIENNVFYAKLSQSNLFETCKEERITAEQYVQELSKLQAKVLSHFENEILDFDYKPILLRYKTEYGSFLKYFKGTYKEDRKQLKAYYKSISEKLTDNQILAALVDLQKIEETKKAIQQKCSHFLEIFGADYFAANADFLWVDQTFTSYASLEKIQRILGKMDEMITSLCQKEETLSNHYEFLYKGMETEWEDIREAVDWAIQFRTAVNEYGVNEEFVTNICTNHDVVDKCREYENTIALTVQNLEKDFHWFQGLFEDQEALEDIVLPILAERVQHCANGLFLLEEWIDFVNARKDCKEEGLSEYIDQIETKKIQPYNILPIFKKRFFRLWLDAILPEYPAVLNFRRINQESTIHEFAELDRMQFEIAKARIKSKLINDLPLLDKFTSGMDEMGILKRELSKQRRIMPIRKLFRQIPNLLLTLKPCLMMSPLSVSLFLEAETYKFDTVIFDEASQVCTENAIGAISRGKQVIIAGDSKQLPPTNFFAASTSDTDLDYDRDDEAEDDNTDAYESILDEASLLPERTLLWHYRSRHEHLIAFSNAKIYHSNLITFPSNVDRVPDNGVEYVYIKEGFYDRGGKNGNAVEAQHVAELVFEHFRKHPHRSLGVIAFGEVQQQAIEMAIRKMRMKNQGYEPFFNEDREEPFFIKNLENVQGDERDTIIFSIGYAKDAVGVFRMNFGPLSKVGGERRLNVAITRAKYNVKLVGSILPTDIDIDRISSEGPKLLRAYIDFAMNGIESLQHEITESDVVQHDSPFEKAVYDFLDRKGYKLATQVGCSGYRIDMAVKHPTLSGQYVLGIECDGAAYHSARTARERDRLRQDILENMGWKIYRIWSTDWIKDPITEGNRLIDAIEDAMKNYGISEPEAEKEIKETVAADFVSVEEKEVSAEELENPYGFSQNELLSFDNLVRTRSGHLLGEDCIMEIVNTLYPVHYDLICHEMAPLYGRTKATVAVKREVDSLLNRLDDRLIRKDDFFFPVGDKKIMPRIHNDRKIDYVSTEELAAAMYMVAKKSVGFTKEILYSETARSYNFRRMTQNITEAMNKAFDLLLAQGKITVFEGKVDILD